MADRVSKVNKDDKGARPEMVSIKMLTERVVGGWACTSFDEYGQVIQATAEVRSVAVEKAKKRTAMRLGLEIHECDFEVNNLVHKGNDQ